jgi:hypothetical protein
MTSGGDGLWRTTLERLDSTETTWHGDEHQFTAPASGTTSTVQTAKQSSWHVKQWAGTSMRWRWADERVRQHATVLFGDGDQGTATTGGWGNGSRGWPAYGAGHRRRTAPTACGSSDKQRTAASFSRQINGRAWGELCDWERLYGGLGEGFIERGKKR